MCVCACVCYVHASAFTYKHMYTCLYIHTSIVLEMRRHIPVRLKYASAFEGVWNAEGRVSEVLAASRSSSMDKGL